MKEAEEQIEVRQSHMIKNIQLLFGSSAEAPALSFEPGAVTVFVGPNNSGKSLILREIGISILHFPANRPHPLLLQGIILEDLDKADVEDFIRKNNPDISFAVVANHINTVSLHGGTVFGDTMTRGTTRIFVHDLDAESEKLGRDRSFKDVVATTRTIILDGSTRLNLINVASAGHVDQRPVNLLTSLLVNHSARKKISDITFDAFGYYFVINPREMTNLRVGMTHRKPSLDELSLGDEGKFFHKDTLPIEEFSDGIKAYTGIVAAIFSDSFRLVLIDEPEAFLHPPLARKLGSIISKRAAEQKGHIFASTHSADFLLGCVQSGSPLNVVRLTYDKSTGTASARLLSSTKLQVMMRNPLLRSSGVLSGLFHRGMVVCEGDIDRVLYEEINERLLNANQGANNVLFINAIGKQTIHKIVKPLRGIGIPAAAVVDLDIIKKNDLGALLRAAFVPEALIPIWNNLKATIRDEFEKLKLDPKKVGISDLSREMQEVAKSLISSVAEYGIFIVPVGEVERWLPYVGAVGEKTAWLEGLLELLGSDPSAKNYVRPQPGDVWDFLRQIAEWLSDPLRKGIPAEQEDSVEEASSE